MRGRTSRIRASRAGEVGAWKARADAQLDVLNAILLAHGSGPDHRMTVAQPYYDNAPRREVVVENFGDRILIRFERPLVGPFEVVAVRELPLSRWQRIVATVRRWFS